MPRNKGSSLLASKIIPTIPSKLYAKKRIVSRVGAMLAKLGVILSGSRVHGSLTLVCDSRTSFLASISRSIDDDLGLGESE